MRKIGYICSENPFTDRKGFSGTIYKLREAIELAGFEVVWIPYDPMYKIDTWRSRLNKRYWEKRKRFFRKTVLEGDLSKANARRYAQSIDVDKIKGCDCLFFPVGGQIARFLKTSVPIIYHSDATVPLMIDYYWFNVDRASKRIAKSLDKSAARRCFINIRSSQWAIESVINDYGCKKNRCFVLELGPNLDSKDICPNPVYEGGRLNILFSGVDWERKGGDIAVETVRLLRLKGVDAHLVIAGIKELPSPYKNEDYIECWGFLDKNKPEEYDKYIQLYKMTHLLLLPTKAECSAIVYSEAAAFGLPCYTYATGGTINYVISDYNGFAFPLGSTPQVFADRIFNDIKEGRMKEYHDNALSLHKNKLSWEAWAARFKSIIDNNVCFDR